MEPEEKEDELREMIMQRKQDKIRRAQEERSLSELREVEMEINSFVDEIEVTMTTHTTLPLHAC